MHLPPWKIIVFAHHWLSKYWDHEAIIKGLHLSSRTLVDWCSFCSEVTDHWIENQGAIGGPGIIVEIDETLIARRKYERGRVLAQVWVFSGIEQTSKKKQALHQHTSTYYRNLKIFHVQLLHKITILL